EGITGFIVSSVEEALDALVKIKGVDRVECRRRFESRFTSRRMADDYLSVYRRLAGAMRKDAEKEAA
ncbi:MAG: glycosyltransferase family 4 protein, partial [Nitrospirota bacterium]